MGKYITMKPKNTPVNLKKIPYNFALILLTLGASLILGFLSFSGMYALLPVLPFAIAAFGLSVAYEGEIYLQNIKGALKKLFKSNYLENSLAKEYLLTHFPEHTKDEDCPQFFRDYKAQLKLLAKFNHKELNAESKKRKKQIEKTLSDMEKWFALQLFSAQDETNSEKSEYAKKLQLWLAEHHQQEWQQRLEQRGFYYNIAKGFSIFAGIFMGLGSTYLIVEAFAVIPFFAAIPFAFWPILILPMAAIAGAAYAMLTFNSITDMINNDTVVKWYQRIRDDLSEGITLRSVFMASTAVLLVGLALALTICTAGTWWTIATNSRPLFEWMKKIPSFVMGIINPIITGLSAISFNIQNSAESLEMIDEATRSDTNIFQTIYDSVVNGFKHLIETENWLQILNPFRLILKLTVTPLRILLFLGHLLSIALTADRMPGVPQIVAMLIAIISEGFEDAHYFIGHSDEDHEHGHHSTKELLEEHLDEDAGHSHDMDIPTWLLVTIASPLYALSALWDSAASQLNSPHDETKEPRSLSFSEAWNKQRGIKEEQEVTLEPTAKRPSSEWQVEHAVALIEKQKRKLSNVSVGHEVADEKIAALNELKREVRTPTQGKTLSETLRNAADNPVYNKHRMFAPADTNTHTQEFIEELGPRVNAVQA
jgi:hypothetical protein